MVYEYQGSDPEIQKKQTGKKWAGVSLKETFETLLQERERGVAQGICKMLDEYFDGLVVMPLPQKSKLKIISLINETYLYKEGEGNK